MRGGPGDDRGRRGEPERPAIGQRKALVRKANRPLTALAGRFAERVSGALWAKRNGARTPQAQAVNCRQRKGRASCPA